MAGVQPQHAKPALEDRLDSSCELAVTNAVTSLDIAVLHSTLIVNPWVLVDSPRRSRAVPLVTVQDLLFT
jgi:hypothetical protein